VIGGLEDEEVGVVRDAVGVAAGVTVGRCVTRPRRSSGQNRQRRHARPAVSLLALAGLHKSSQI
jgi:hypothetical protein